MDDALNNTSVILLFEAGGKKLLFPGDAQWENWELALNEKAARAEGRGHLQGRTSRQPERDAEDPLEQLLEAVGEGRRRGRLVTVMSTRSDSKHGHAESETEVPRAHAGHRAEAQQRAPIDAGAGADGGLVLTLEFDLTKP